MTVDDEIRSVSVTGAEKGTKLARFDLIAATPLRELAEHYGKGSRKYDKFGECTCHVDVQQSDMRAASVARATSETSGDAIPSSPKGSAHSLDCGTTNRTIESEGARKTVSADECEDHNPPRCTGSTNSNESSTSASWQSHAGFAAHRQSILTTTTPPEQTVADSATAAISGSDTSKGGSPNTMSRHSPGCAALTLISSGDRNWERGYEWSKSYAALQRHANAFWAGEDYDPETLSKHIIAVAWHALALAEYMETHREFDDRVTRQSQSPRSNA